MSDWRRLEGTNVDPEMTEGLSARIADPLWSLCRQWQVGEFHGEDAASPLLVAAEVESIPLTSVRAGGTQAEIRAVTPIESIIEAEAITGGRAALRLRLESGRALLDRLRVVGGDDAVAAVRAAYPIGSAALDGLDDTLDPVGAARLRFLAPRCCDAIDILEAWWASGRDASTIGVVAALEDPVTVGAAIDRWAITEGTMFDEPNGADAWVDERLAYRFRLRARQDDREYVLGADDYPGGNLDWFHVDILGVERRDGEDGKGPTAPRAPKGTTEPTGPTGPKPQRPPDVSVEVLASPLRYAGQPAARFWEFEDGDVNFGDLAGGPEDLARSVIAAFGAMAGDDWLLVPVTLRVGVLAQVRSVHVIDGFGGRWSIPSVAVADTRAGRAGLGPRDRPWRFFELHGDPGPGADAPRPPLLFLPPVLDTLETSRPIEAVEFRRDEMANLAWGIERRVESAWGHPVDRDSTIAARPAPDPETWDFTLATPIPPSWVPLVPVQRPGRWPEIVLQRGRLATDEPAEATAVESVILGSTSPFLLCEEEIPDGGVRVTRRYQYARDHRGGTHLWLSRRVAPASGPMRRTPLRFDDLRTPGAPAGPPTS
jgi:hypothetical protein